MSNPLDSFFPHLWQPGEDAQWLERISKANVIAVDYETAGKGKAKFAALDMRTAYAVGISVAWREEDEVISVYLPLRHELSKLNHPDTRAILEKLLTNPNQMRVFHQARFEVGITRVEGVEPAWPWSDTMVMSWLYDENVAKKLKLLGEHYIGWKPLEYSQFGDIPFSVIPPDIAFRYACQDAHLTLLLYEFFRSKFDQFQTQLYDRLEMEVGRILINMEYTGIPVDLPLMNEYRATAKSKMEELENEIAEALQVSNPNAPKQLMEGCRSRGVMLPSTAVDKLQVFLATNPGIPPDVRSALTKLRAYRYIKNKVLGTYITAIQDSLFDDGRIHPHFHQWYVSETEKRTHGTVTGRFSTTDPALQTFPKEHDDRDDVLKDAIPGLSIRKLMGVPNDNFVYVTGDLSQVEVRVAASVAGETKLIDVFSAGSGDIHRLIASYIFNKPPETVSGAERQLGKKVVFTSLYFGGVAKIASAIWEDALKVLYTDKGLPVPGEVQARRDVEGLARRVRTQFYTAFPAFKTYPDRVTQALLKHGEVRTRMGRSRRFPDFHVTDHRMIRQAGNFLIQSQAVDICKLAMVALAKKIEENKWEAYMIGQVHDEIILISHRDCAQEVAKALYSAFKEQEWCLNPVVSLDSEVSVGYSWGSTKKFNPFETLIEDICPRRGNTYDGEAVREALKSIINDAVSCARCPIFEKWGWKKVFYEGKVSEPIDLVIVGANPSKGDLMSGRPFASDYGNLLRDELARCGIDTSSGVLLVNALVCSSPSQEGITAGDIARCSTYLDRVLSVVNPRVVLVLGSVAHRAVLRTTRGNVEHGWYTGPFPYKVFSTYHPGYLLGSRGYLPKFRDHLREVLRALPKKVRQEAA